MIQHAEDEESLFYVLYNKIQQEIPLIEQISVRGMARFLALHM